MEAKARLVSLGRVGGETVFTLSTDSADAAMDLERMRNNDLRVRVVRYRKPRSLNANSLLWHCIGEIAKATDNDIWAVYLDMLCHYGQSTFICCRESAVETVKKQWRACIELGPVKINGKPGVQMQVFYGSSTYDTAEMSRLIDGAIETMRQLDLELPMPADIRAALGQWEPMYGEHNSD